MVCPDGKYSMPGSDDSGDCLCPPNAYSQQNARYVTECICDSGYYKEYNGLFALGGWYCKLCLPGEFCYNNTNRTCPDHSSSYGVAKTYLDCFCDAGYRNVTTARTEQAFCEDCPANNYCTGKGDVQSCVPNAVSPTQSKIYTRCYCDFGWKGVNNSACVGCQSPTYCYGGVEAQCSEGTYSPSLAWDRLNCSCIAGRWGPTGGPCIICSAGKYNTFPGCIACSNTTDLDCSLCEIGTASSALGRNTTCDVCPAGKYSYPPNQKGATTCVDCGNGTFSGVGAGNCTPCADGRYSTGGAGVCTLCPVGTYGGGMVSVCTSCPAGMYGPLGPDSSIRTYPPKSFDYGTAETASTFLGRPAFSQNITLNSTGISYGIGQYSLFFSSKAPSPTLQKSNLFLSKGGIYVNWQVKAYNQDGVFNTTYVNNSYILSDYPGEWLVIQFPTLIRLTGYNMIPAILDLNHPGEFKFYASTDGLLFTEIPQASVMNRLPYSSAFFPNGRGPGFNKTVIPSSDPLLYLGFTVNKLNTRSSVFSALWFSKFIIYGTEFLDLWTLPDRCASCPTGTYSTVLGSPSSLTCTNCKAGTYSTVVGAASIFDCSTCLAGTYSLLGAYGCQPCSPGTYSTAVGSVNVSTCAVCLAGTFLTQQGGTGCDQCLAGYFSGVSGLNTTCGTCMAGKYSVPANQKGATFCEACANGTVSGVGNGNCTSCLNGSYAVSGDSVCTQCAAGTYGGGVVTACTSCPAGMYGIDGLDSEVRTYPPKVFDTSTSEVLSTFRGKPAYNQNITLSSTGISYGIGQYSLYYSSIYSTNSLMKSNLFTLMSTGAWGFGLYNTNGTYIGSASISDGYMGDWLVIRFPVPFKLTAYRFTTFSSTPSRAPGEWKIYGSNDGWNFTVLTQASVETRITTSHYTNQAYYKSVLPPPDANLYLGFVFNKLSGGTTGNNLLGFDDLILYGTEVLDGWTIANKCVSCAAGKYSNVSAATSSSTCASCSAGSYSSVVGANTAGICTSCSTGKYSPTNGATVCLECGTGAYSTTAGAWNASQCTACIPGTYSTTSGAWNSTQCTPCSPGKYSTILGAPAPSNCSACLPGKVSDKAGSVDCSVCSPGTYATIQSSACTVCVEGTYSFFQASVCTTCDPGSFSPINAPVCTSCPEGTYTTGSGSGNCSQCEAGTYSLRAAVVCSICGIGTFNAERGRWNCTDCLDGAFAGEGETEVRKRRRRRPLVACLIRDSSDPHVLFWARSVPSVSWGRGGWGDWNRIRTARGAVQGDTRPCWADRAPTSARRARLANFPTRQGRAR